MPRGSGDIVFEGLFAEGVLGIFRVIRGYADLRDLAEISVPYTMDSGPGLGLVDGHQRLVSDRHAEEIKQYLERSENRFLPEVILSMRVPVKLVGAHGESSLDELALGDAVYGVTSVEDAPVRITRRFARASARIQRLRIRRRDLGRIKQEKVVRRIDGNHRLHLAAELKDDPNIPSKYLAPFCMVLLGAPGDTADDYAESLMFHTINSKALALESEHGLRLLLGQHPEHTMTPENEFAYSPELHLARLLADNLRRLPEPAKARFGSRPLTALWESGRNLIAMDACIATDRETMTSFAEELFAALADIVTKLVDKHPSLCRTYGFFELAGRAWRRAGEAEGADYEKRVSWTVKYLEGLGDWLGCQGITEVLNPQPPAELLLNTYEAARSRIPKRVFLARWYPQENAPDGAYAKSELRFQQIQRTLNDVQQQYAFDLELIDMGTEQGATFPIHPRMYEAIKASDIIVCDLTGGRPNVYVEAGYALGHHEKGRLVFLFQPTHNGEQVPFDLTTFKYVRFSDAAEIPQKLGSEIKAILDAS